MTISTLLARSAVALTLVAALAVSGCSSTASSTSDAKPQRSAAVQRPDDTVTRRDQTPITRTGEVILLRGLANIFSRGMDVIHEKLVAKGVDARVYNHASWEDLARDLIARAKRKQVSYPIIIMGHSLGANQAVVLASYLGARGVPVEFVVAFDPTVATVAGKNVRRVVNYYLPNGENRVRKGSGFKGKLSNVNVTNMNDVTHMNVEKNPTLQSRSIKTVMSLTKKKRRSSKRRRG